MPRDTFFHLPTASDSSCDISDAWREQSDPKNENGENCIAYFDHGNGYAFDSAHNDVPWISATLCGISVDDGHGAWFCARERALHLLGTEAVERIEAAHERDLNKE